MVAKNPPKNIFISYKENAGYIIEGKLQRQSPKLIPELRTFVSRIM